MEGHPEVVNADVLMLISIDTLDKEKLVANNVKNELISNMLGWSLPITRGRGYIYITWSLNLSAFTRAEFVKCQASSKMEVMNWFTKAEPAWIHKHFCHPGARKLYELLKRTKTQETKNNTFLSKYGGFSDLQSVWEMVSSVQTHFSNRDMSL